MAGALEGDVFVGPKAEEHRGLLTIRYPIEHGIVTDWNDMEKIWQYIYSKDQLQTFSEEVSGFEVLSMSICRALRRFRLSAKPCLPAFNDNRTSTLDFIGCVRGAQNVDFFSIRFY